LAGDLSNQPLTRKVEQRFGLPGFARLVKLLELLAASPCRDAGLIEMPVSDWLEALRCGREEFDTFLAYLTAANWLTVEQDAEAGAPLRVTLLLAESLLPTADSPQLYTKPCQWAAWCVVELGMPPSLSTDPYNQQLYRRWCASNVTTLEMQAAVHNAVKGKNSLSPQVLHEELQLIRRQRLDKARA
jgi:hypothetical protein